MNDNPSIQVLSPKFAIDECLAEIRECLEKGWTGMGFKTLEFEQKWNEYSGHYHSHFLASNTAGLELALRIFGDHYQWEQGSEIISTPFTFVSTNHAILHQGFTPVFADIDETLCLNPDSIRERITERTKAIMYVGIGGNTGRYADVLEIGKELGLPIILDAAHMAGTRWHGKHVGPEADVAVYSFQAVKNLPTADSGMICFKNSEFDAAARKYSWLGIDKDTFNRTTVQGSYKWYYDVEVAGFKYHGNSIMASLGLVGLKYLDEHNDIRRKLSNQYVELLNDVPVIELVPIAEDCESSRHLCQIRTSHRNELYSALTERNIFPGVHYRNNCEYTLYKDQFSKCPVAATVSEEVLSLPLHVKLSAADIERVSNVIKAWATQTVSQ
ncbi:MAG: DegT/DnrJ/EryC1/StrS family aminotransferase [Planctomycetota bacterium]